MRITHTKISASVDTGLDYWYFTRHGLGPGMMPNDVHLLDVYEDGYKTWIKLDKMLTTEELNYYDIQEKWPPAGVTTRNGDVIEACDDVKASNSVGPNPIEHLDRFTVNMFGDYADSYDCKTPLAGLTYGVGEDVDEEGEYWRLFTPESWKKVKHLSNEEIWNKYPVAPIIEEVEGCDSIKGTECKKVAEDKNSISYVVGTEEVEDDFEEVDQEFSSAETAINGKQGKLPAAFKKASIPNGALVLDYGGGTVESEAVAQKYLDEFEAKEMLYDPFNQTAEHNREVIAELRKNGGADVAICSNVLNVIKEEEVRLDVLKKIARLLKPGANAYITVYEGSGKGDGGATQNGKSYQNKRKLSTYMDEILQVFPEAVRKGSVIVAPNKSVEASTEINSSTNIDDINLIGLRKEIEDACIDYLASEGFKRPGEEREDKWDMFADEMFVVDIDKKDDCIVVNVRAELGYDGMTALADILDPILAKYDPESYFEQVEGGMMEAFICNTPVAASTEIKADSMDRQIANLRDEWLEPPAGDYYPEERDPVIIDFDFDFKLIITDKGNTIDVADGVDPLEDVDIEAEELDVDSVFEDFMNVLEWHLPYNDGIYKVKGKASLKYDYDAMHEKYEFMASESSITDVEYEFDEDVPEDIIVEEEEEVESCVKVDGEEIEASEKVEGAMTEEELDDAIEKGKSFDLADFKKYKDEMDTDAITSDQVEVGDIISIDQDASEVNLGTVVRVNAINDPKEDWVDFTFKCEVITDPGEQSIKEGDEIDLHFDADEAIGHLVPQ